MKYIESFFSFLTAVAGAIRLRRRRYIPPCCHLREELPERCYSCRIQEEED
ncbi:MAG: hypothetical protein LUD02_07655 [Tannerellaceae bacterium]|nr:hypothetical protein [Tannerellaceae bacterium]